MSNNDKDRLEVSSMFGRKNEESPEMKALFEEIGEDKRLTYFLGWIFSMKSEDLIPEPEDLMICVMEDLIKVQRLLSKYKKIARDK